MSRFDHLLRTLASIPLGVRIALVDAAGSEAEGLLTRLGFSPVRMDAPVSEAPPEPAAGFDWVVVVDPWDGETPGAVARLRWIRRLVVPGGWVYALSTRSSDASMLTAEFLKAGFAVAEPATSEAGAPGAHGIYRRVEVETQR